MTEQSMQPIGETSAQKPEKTRKKRTRADKIGRIKYNQFLLKRILIEIKEIKDIERIILTGLKGAGYFHFDMPLIQKLACVDQVDLEILERVHNVGLEGVYPKDVAADLPEYKLKYYDVTRRIQRMNKRLEHKTGEKLFEKRGHKWALTRFGFEMFGVSKNEIEQEKPGSSDEEGRWA